MTDAATATLTRKKGIFKCFFHSFGPRIASKGWHKRILFKSASMIDSPHTIFFSRPPNAWKHKVRELRVALQAISVHECHDMCLLLEQELQITPERNYYKTLVSATILLNHAIAKFAKFRCSNIVYDDSSDDSSGENTVSTTMTTTTVASL